METFRKINTNCKYYAKIYINTIINCINIYLYMRHLVNLLFVYLNLKNCNDIYLIIFKILFKNS